MNRKRPVVLIALASVIAILAVLTGIALASKGGGSAEPPASQRQSFAFDAAYADLDPMVLVVRYGDSSSCPSAAVGHHAVQEATRVVVTLTRSPMPGDQPCTSDYGARLVRVELTAPLGGRAVVDGSRSTPVPISTGSPTFG